DCMAIPLFHYLATTLRYARFTLRENVEDWIALFDSRQLQVESLKRNGQAAAVDSQRVQDRSLKVGDMNWIGHHIVADIVGLAVDDTWLDAASGHEDREATGMVIATITRFGQCALAVDGATEFAAPYDQGVV